MHELAIAQSLYDVVAVRAAECGADRVKAVRLRIGEASGVVPDALSFCFELLADADPVVRGARLLIDAVPHRAWCEGCADAFAVEGFVARCPACGAWSERVLSGTELQVFQMEIESRHDHDSA